MQERPLRCPLSRLPASSPPPQGSDRQHRSVTAAPSAQQETGLARQGSVLEQPRCQGVVGATAVHPRVPSLWVCPRPSRIEALRVGKGEDLLGKGVCSVRKTEATPRVPQRALHAGNGPWETGERKSQTAKVRQPSPGAARRCPHSWAAEASGGDGDTASGWPSHRGWGGSVGAKDTKAGPQCREMTAPPR